MFWETKNFVQFTPHFGHNERLNLATIRVPNQSTILEWAKEQKKRKEIHHRLSLWYFVAFRFGPVWPFNSPCAVNNDDFDPMLFPFKFVWFTLLLLLAAPLPLPLLFMWIEWSELFWNEYVNCKFICRLYVLLSPSRGTVANEKRKKFPIFTRKCLIKSNVRSVTTVNVFFLSRTWILKPHLCHSLAQSRYRCNSFKILTVRIAVYLKICLQHLQLFFGKCCPHAFRFTFVISFGVTTVCKAQWKLHTKD